MSILDNSTLLESNIKLKTFSVVWVGDIDKPIPKIVLCNNCVKKTIPTRYYSYLVSQESLNEIQDKCFSKSSKRKIELKINEQNKLEVIAELKKIVIILKEHNEDSKIIDKINYFIGRIDY
jgi:hypothetical protein